MPSASTFLTPFEVKRALDSLSDADVSRLALAAKGYASFTRLDWEDLLHEAYVRALGGERKWPRNVDIHAFFRGVMRSIRRDWLRTWTREHGDVLDSTGTFINGKKELQALDLNPEEQLLLNEISAQFGDDLPGRRVFQGLCLGLKGADLQEFSEIDDNTRFASAYKRVMRKLLKHFPDRNNRSKQNEQAVSSEA